MMDMQDVVTLSNGSKYVVISKIILDNQVYYFLINEDNQEDIKFVLELENNGLRPIEDNNLINKLAPLFLEEANNHLSEEEKQIVGQMKQVLIEKLEQE
jgi:hypothetical protein